MQKERKENDSIINKKDWSDVYDKAWVIFMMVLYEEEEEEAKNIDIRFCEPDHPSLKLDAPSSFSNSFRNSDLSLTSKLDRFIALFFSFFLRSDSLNTNKQYQFVP